MENMTLFMSGNFDFISSAMYNVREMVRYLSLIVNYLLGTGENYGPTAQHAQDCPIFIIQLYYVHNQKNEVLTSSAKLCCHKVAPSILLSQFSHFA